MSTIGESTEWYSSSALFRLRPPSFLNSNFHFPSSSDSVPILSKGIQVFTTRLTCLPPLPLTTIPES